MVAPSKKVSTVVITAGGNKTFATLTRDSKTGYMGWQFVDDEDSGVSTTVTINLEVTYDGETWETLTDGNGDDVTGTIASAGSLSFSLSDVPLGAMVRPKFVTDATGTVIVSTWS